MPLIVLSSAWVAGIFLGSNFDLPPALIMTGLIPLSLLFFFRQRKRRIILTGLMLFAFFTGAVYSHSSLQEVDEHDLRFYNDIGTADIRGLITTDPEVRDRVTHIKLSATEIKTDKDWQEVEGTALLFVPRYPAYKYGDVLQAKGSPESPPQFDDFDYQGYLAHQGIYTTILYPEIEIQERDSGFRPLAWVYSLRNHMAQTITEVLPEPHASLAKAILLGKRGSMPQSLRDDFARTGTAHLLAISGLHLGIVAGILLSVGVWLLGRRYYLYVWLALGTIWLYALITGMHPPVVRGAIMASLFLTAELLGRQRSAITALTFAAAAMVGTSPYILGDAAFQLSFLAMAGLVFIFPTLRVWGRRAIKASLGEEGTPVTIASIASDSLSVTLAAIIAVWPVVAHYFGIISFAGPLATFLLLPALPGVIVTGALTAMLGFLALPAAQVAGWLTWLFLLYIVWVVEGLATMPLSFMEIGAVSPVFIWSYYFVLAAAIWLNSRRTGWTGPIRETTIRIRAGANTSLAFISRLPRKLAVPPLLVIAILISLTAATMPDDNLHVSFLDVGEGDAIFIQKGNTQILVDGGPSPQAINMALGSKMPFWDRTIDLLILTHPHHDHLTGLAEVLLRYRVKQVLFPEADYESPVYDEWLKLITEKNIRSTAARAGQQIALDEGAIIRVLNPLPTPLAGTRSDTDNNGVVLHLSQGKVSFLLTTDIMQEAEWELLRRRAKLSSSVLKVAHHGSDTSTTPEFLAVVNPQLAVISAGADNKFGHPSGEVLARLKARIGSQGIFRTDMHGTIECITDGERLWVEVERQATPD